MAEPPAPASSIPDSVPAVGFDDEDAQHLSASDMRGHRTLSTSSAGSSSMPSLSRTTSTHSTAESEGGFQEGVDLLASSGLPLAEMLETFWDSRVDLIDRKWKTFSDEIKHNARNKRDKLVHRAKSRTEVKIMQKEAQKLRKGVSDRFDKVAFRWNEAKTVRLRDKVSFVVGTMNLVVSSLAICLRPEWVPVLYTVQAAYFLPLRIYSYTRKRWHYFLFDFCYFLNMANLIFLWLMPHSVFLFTVCYCAAFGPLAFSIMAWRNSYVMHSVEKMTSLFIHLYPMIVFHAIRFCIPRPLAQQRYPALVQLDELNSRTAFGFSIIMYAAWQTLYWVFVAHGKKDKIASGARINSYSTMTQGKGALAGVLSKTKPHRREAWFMLVQFVYTIVTMLPAPCLFYRNKVASATFLLFVLTVSVINGAGYYVEVWSRKFEKELLALKKQIEEAKAAEQAAVAAAEDGAESSAAVSRRTSQEIDPEELEEEIKKNR